MSDIEGIFEDSLLSLFDHRPIAFSTPAPDQPYVYSPSAIQGINGNVTTQDTDLVVPVHLPIAPSALHTTLQLTHIWLSSVLLADLIVSREIDVKGERICELGAGAGLPGIVAARMGARGVISTDYAVPRSEDGEGDDVLAVLRGNFRRSIPDAVAVGGADAPQKFTMLFLADLLWTTSAHASLVTSIINLLCPRTGTAHVVAGLHQGRGAVERFKRSWLDRTAARGGWVKDLLEVQWDHTGWEVLRDFRMKDRTGAPEEGGDEHGTVVWFTIGLRDDP
ncbi:hypothetical protein QFC20_000947 [Naganishia adeliensis]|uniref:Uncharacterized protein n=1 Tax=Naganishia adeliensis TaxID=92952 RepID=A0ACC2WWU4_9TREE|nr:hypothetical protein QFC20_000947 [Naganishia adeliensis]